jgi:hypothetical protein
VIWVALALTGAFILWAALDKNGDYAPGLGMPAAMLAIPLIWLMVLAAWVFG